jgi:hypothetical protein
MLIEVTIPSKPSLSLLPLKSDILNASPYSVATTNPARSHKSMGSTMNVSENMAMRTYGSTSQTSLITFPLLPLSTTKSSAYTEVSPPASIPLTTSERSIVYKKFHMRGLCAICCGRIQMIDVDGEYHQEARGIRSDRISQRLSTTIMA